MSATAEPRQNPRTTRVRQVILDKAIELLLRGGASEVTATRVSEETGVARTTIYRQWPDQPGLLLATIAALVAPHSPSPSSGDLERDLTTALTNLRTRLTTRQVRPVFAALVDYARRDEAFVDAQRRFVEGMMQPTDDVLRAAQERGDLAASIDPSVATTTLTGPIFHQFLMLQGEIGDALIAELISQFLRANAGD